jgi:hypothetical protein
MNSQKFAESDIGEVSKLVHLGDMPAPEEEYDVFVT